jgi:peptide/nickel transport system substrate-binding protein
MRDLSQRSVPRRAVSRRSLIKMFIAAGSGVSAAQLLAACSSVPAAPMQAPAVTTGPTKAPAPTSAVAPFQLAAPGVVVPPITMPAPSGAASDQTLSYAHQSKLLYLDPAQESGYGRFIISLVWLPPFLLDDKMNLTPGTCNAYEVSSDGLIYTLHVDPNAKWSDGSKFTARDIKSWIEYCSSPTNPSVYRTDARYVAGHGPVNKGDTRDMTGLVASDDLTLKITLTQKDPLFHYSVLANYRFGGPKADVAYADPNTWWSTNPVATGPFKIEKFDPDSLTYSFVPNPGYWRTPKPTLQRINLLTVTDPQTIVVMWQNNQIDAMFVSGSDAIDVEQKWPDSIIPMPNYGGNFFWSFNFTKEPTNDPLVRKALKHAVDVNTIAQTQYFGMRKPAKGPISPYAPGSRYDTLDQQNEFFKYDPDLAKQELSQSSYKSADNLPTLAITPNAPSGDKVRATEMVVEMWRKNLGITNIEGRPMATDYGAPIEYVKTINFLRISLGGLPDAATLVYSMAHSAGAIAAQFAGGYKNPAVDAAIEKAMGLNRSDPDYLKSAYQAEDLYLADYMYVPLYVDRYSYYAKPWVKNFKANWNNLMYTLDQTYLAAH